MNIVHIVTAIFPNILLEFSVIERDYYMSPLCYGMLFHVVNLILDTFSVHSIITQCIAYIRCQESQMSNY